MFARAAGMLLAGVVVASCSSGTSTSTSDSPSPGPTAGEAAEVAGADPFADLNPLATWTFEPDDPGAVNEMAASLDSAGVPSGGTSVRFDGETEYIEVVRHTDPGADELKPNDALTVTFWYRVERGPADDEHDYLARWRWYGWGVRLTDDSIFADVWHSPTDSEPIQTTLEGPAIDEGWHHLALTFDGLQGRLSIDGKVVAEAPAEGPIRYESVPEEDDCCGTGGALGFGRDADVDGNYFAGWLDDIALFDRALELDEIAALATS